VEVPDHLNSNTSSVPLLNAALVAGLYPKVLAIDPANGQMRTISNNQAASFHPTSVNHGRKPADLGAHYLSFFTLMYVAPPSWPCVQCLRIKPGNQSECTHGKLVL
jgi:ATP-dependent RNA helicase DHX29